MIQDPVMDSCVFCEIVAGTRPAHVVHGTPGVIAFMDQFRQPSDTAHVLVIPRTHVENIYGIEPALGAELFAVHVLIARAIKHAFVLDGITTWSSNERGANQEVPHFHLHVYPRRVGVVFPPPIQKPRLPVPDEILGPAAARIRAAIDELRGRPTSAGVTDHNARNAAMRARLRDLVDRLTDDDLRRVVNGWTVAAVLAHIAFWDRINLARWKAIRAGLPLEGSLFPPGSIDWTNEAAAPQWNVLPGRAAAEDAVRAAEDLDATIALLSPSEIESAIANDRRGMLDRTGHREQHLDRIEEAVRGTS